MRRHRLLPHCILIWALGIIPLAASQAVANGTVLTLQEAVAKATARGELIRNAQQQLENTLALQIRASAYTPLLTTSADVSSSRTAGLDPGGGGNRH
jgi:hypothetical protein